MQCLHTGAQIVARVMGEVSHTEKPYVIGVYGFGVRVLSTYIVESRVPVLGTTMIII